MRPAGPLRRTEQARPGLATDGAICDEAGGVCSASTRTPRRSRCAAMGRGRHLCPIGAICRNHGPARTPSRPALSKRRGHRIPHSTPDRQNSGFDPEQGADRRLGRRFRGRGAPQGPHPTPDPFSASTALRDALSASGGYPGAASSPVAHWTPRPALASGLSICQKGGSAVYRPVVAVAAPCRASGEMGAGERRSFEKNQFLALSAGAALGLPGAPSRLFHFAAKFLTRFLGG